jgi:hypothetical protein
MPVDIHQRYKVLNRAIYGISRHGRWSGAFKPANASLDLEGLYLAGGSPPPPLTSATAGLMPQYLCGFTQKSYWLMHNEPPERLERR